MELDELKNKWNQLDKKADEFEKQNKDMIREALNKKTSRLAKNFIRKLCLKLLVLSSTFLLLIQINKEFSDVVSGDWLIRICGLFLMFNIIAFSFNYKLLLNADPMRNSTIDTLRNGYRFTQYFKVFQCINMSLAALVLAFMLPYFYAINISMFYGALIGLVIGLVIAVFVFIRVRREIAEMKASLDELQKISN